MQQCVRLFSFHERSHMETTTKPFTLEQWHALNAEQRAAVNAVAEYFTAFGIEEQGRLTEEPLSNIFNLLKQCSGCVPAEELGDDVSESIRRKFSAVYQTGLEMAERKLNQQGIRQFEVFSFCLLIQPSFDDATHIVIVDYQLPVCYIHEWTKAWNFHFASLAQLADEVLKVRNALVERVMALPKQMEVYVVLENGTVREVIGAPENAIITILDYDLEGADPCEIKVSPVDGEACRITKF
jgi:hypothetical protein